MTQVLGLPTVPSETGLYLSVPMNESFIKSFEKKTYLCLIFEQNIVSLLSLHISFMY